VKINRDDVLGTVLSLLLIFSWACTKNYYSTGPSESSVKVTVRLTNDSLNLVVGQSHTAFADVTVPSGKSSAVTWTTKCNVINLSDSGVIKALAPGACKVVVTPVADGLVSDTLYVTVYASLTGKSPASISVKKGQSVPYIFTFSGGLPGTVTSGKCASSNPALVTVINTGPSTCQVTGVGVTTGVPIWAQSDAVDPVQGHVTTGTLVVVTP